MFIASSSATISRSPLNDSHFFSHAKNAWIEATYVDQDGENFSHDFPLTAIRNVNRKMTTRLRSLSLFSA